jgi:uncharacterized protein (DUF58 family)
MAIGSPSSKFEFAARIAAAVAYVGLAGYDLVRATLFTGAGSIASTKALAGKARIFDVFDLFDAAASGVTDLAAALQAFAEEAKRPGVAFIFSDFMDPSGVLGGIRPLVGRKFAVHALHVVAGEDIAPDLSSDLEIEDIETHGRIPLHRRKDTASRFRVFFEGHCEELRADFVRYGVRYTRVSTEETLDDVLFTRLPKEGVLQ